MGANTNPANTYGTCGSCSPCSSEKTGDEKPKWLVHTLLEEANQSPHGLENLSTRVSTRVSTLFQGTTQISKSERPQRRAALEVQRIRTGRFSAGDFARQNQGGLEKFYTIDWGAPIGNGACSFVYRGRNNRTQQEFAVKAVKRSYLKRNDIGPVENEILILRLLDHPNVVRLYESCKNHEHVLLVLEICSAGTLFDRVVDEPPVSNVGFANCGHQMLRVAAYLHTNNIIHRDLKAENWLLPRNTQIECTTLKLCDFGTARRLDAGDSATTKVGTPYYIAPEVLQGSYDEKADIWSIGVLLYTLAAGRPPYGGETQTVFANLRDRTYTPVHFNAIARRVGFDALQVVQSMLCRAPSKRPGAQETLKHPVFAPNRDSFAKLPCTILHLQKFNALAPLQQRILTCIAKFLSDDALYDLERAFFAMDTDCDGTLSPSEFFWGLRINGFQIDETESKRLFSQLDTDGSGALDYTEFVAAAMDQDRIDSSGACSKAFESIDLDGKGFIDRREMEMLWYRYNDCGGKDSKQESKDSKQESENHEHIFSEGSLKPSAADVAMEIGRVFGQIDADFALKLDDFATMVQSLDRTGSRIVEGSSRTRPDEQLRIKPLSARQLRKEIYGRSLSLPDMKTKKTPRKRRNRSQGDSSPEPVSSPNLSPPVSPQGRNASRGDSSPDAVGVPRTSPAPPIPPPPSPPPSPPPASPRTRNSSTAGRVSRSQSAPY